MNRLKLIEILSSCSEEEVFIVNPDTGRLDEISDIVNHYEESFDGFETAEPAAIGLKIVHYDHI